ncbi:MAG TPA: hypothetical protein EYO33_19340 [Phycisphaerales bacterium]|nr:hypothetical protein [Phycisphaerales bacterium]
MTGTKPGLGLLAILMTLFLSSWATAQDDALKNYIVRTDHINKALLQTVGSFINEVKPLKEEKDIVGLKEATDKYIEVWGRLLGDLEKIEAPQEAELHYRSLKRMLELQRESNQILSETLGDRIKLIRDVQAMKKNGSSEQEMKAYIQSNSIDKDQLLARTAAVKKETIEVDATIKSERERLAASAGMDESQEGKTTEG